MKICIHSSKYRQQGVATIVMLTILTIVFIYVGINARSIINLEREVKVVEQRQIQWWSSRGGLTNSPVIRETSETQ